MEQDIKRILEMLEDIKRDIDYIKRKMESKDDSGEHAAAKRISTGPDVSIQYSKINEKSKWDIDSIDGLIE
ncbi:MAG TPA: hypothetical protein PK718_00795 [Candidatus Methanofastidiosa archaeon]|nr:hypothetical protein [Candidatus Methanofastidiosa archaeon]HPR41071.1 hypothetical protein [Candidatus Methanofastidiosa archaeon]